MKYITIGMFVAAFVVAFGEVIAYSVALA